MMTAVSIIIPCYNQGHFLAQALRSVLQQSFSNWEAVIVDDGSTDETRLVAKGFSDPRIQYLYQENRGLAGARNSGIRIAKSELIALLDADDIWEFEFLERMVDSLNNSSAVAAYCGYRYIDLQGKKVGEASLKIVPPEQFRKTLLHEGNWLIPSAVVFRKSGAEDVGLFDESLKALEDTDLWIRLSEHDTFVGVDALLAGYRVHEGSMSRDPDRMVSACRQLTEKIYGPAEGNSDSWGECKKSAYARYYRYGALAYLAQGDAKKSADYFHQLFALDLDKEMALSMGMWRAFARVHLPLQYRDQAFSNEDFKEAEKSVCSLIHMLDNHVACGDMLSRDLRRIKSRAYLALAEEGVNSRYCARTGFWFWRTIACYPSALLAKPYWGTIIRWMIAISKFKGSS